jgi:hypothetical protein
MSTRSMIGKVEAGGRIKAVYCHWGGAPNAANNGGLLATYWNDPAQLDQLIAMGSLSSLGQEIGEYHAWDNYDHPEWCSFHQRDWRRGPKGYEAVEFLGPLDYVRGARDVTCAFCYLWTADRGWLFAAVPGVWPPLLGEIEAVEWQSLAGYLAMGDR